MHSDSLPLYAGITHDSHSLQNDGEYLPIDVDLPKPERDAYRLGVVGLRWCGRCGTMASYPAGSGALCLRLLDNRRPDQVG